MDAYTMQTFLEDSPDEFDELLSLCTPTNLIKKEDDFIYKQLKTVCFDLLSKHSNANPGDIFSIDAKSFSVPHPRKSMKRAGSRYASKRKKLQFGATSSSRAASEFIDSDIEDEQIYKFLKSRKKKKLSLKLKSQPNRKDSIMQLRLLNHFENKSEEEFFHDLRVTRKTYEHLLEKIKEANLFGQNFAGGNVPILADQALQMFLYYMGTRCTYKFLSEMYYISESAIMSSFMKCVEGINRLDDQEVRWPSSPSELKTIQSSFKSLAGLPGVIGSVGCCCTEMRTNKEPPAGYKIGKLRSIMYLLGVTDADCRFIYIQAGFPGTFSVQEAFESSSLGEMMKTNSASLFLDSNTHLIGSSDFTLHKHLLVPYPQTGNLTDSQVTLNSKIAESNVCEEAFIKLKSRFTSLQTQVYANLEKIPNIIKACCIVHNIAFKDPEDKKFLLRELTEISEDYSAFRDDSDFIPTKPEKAAFLKRDAIAKKVAKI